MNETISSEYAAALRNEHQGIKGWGTTGYRYGGADIVSLIEDRPYINTVLDFGCGKGTMEEYVKKIVGRPIEWTSYDPGIPGLDTMPKGKFDLVITCDVMEHVEPDKLAGVIEGLEDFTGKVMYNNIACYPTGKIFTTGKFAGKDLHLIVEDPHWWRMMLDCKTSDDLALFEYRHIERLRRGMLQPRCVLIHERVR